MEIKVAEVKRMKDVLSKPSEKPKKVKTCQAVSGDNCSDDSGIGEKKERGSQGE